MVTTDELFTAEVADDRIMGVWQCIPTTSTGDPDVCVGKVAKYRNGLRAIKLGNTSEFEVGVEVLIHEQAIPHNTAGDSMFRLPAGTAGLFLPHGGYYPYEYEGVPFLKQVSDGITIGKVEVRFYGLTDVSSIADGLEEKISTELHLEPTDCTGRLVRELIRLNLTNMAGKDDLVILKRYIFLLGYDTAGDALLASA